MATCEHENFEAAVDVNRLTRTEGGPVEGYMADVRVHCADCAEPFEFIGLPVGVNPRGAAGSVDAQEARLPLRPRSASTAFGLDLAGYSLRMGIN